MIRKSNFEALRLISMFFIVLYHILFFIIVNVDDSIVYKVLWLPLHVGVICFVLISGYFHIKPSLRGIVKLIYPLVVFYLPLTIWELSHGIGNTNNLLFFSKSPYWFIRTYLCLFLVSPVLNAFLTSHKHRLYLLSSLGFIAIYMGIQDEPSLNTGKNVVLFMFVYVLGDCLKTYKNIYDNWKFKYVICIYLVYNVLIMLLYVNCQGTIISKTIWSLGYQYYGPLLILNAMLLFVLFAKVQFKSRIINSFAASVFAIYIIHHQNYVLESVIKPVSLWIHGLSDSPIVVLSYLSVQTLAIMLICIFIDKLFSPIWKFITLFVNKLEVKIAKID